MLNGKQADWGAPAIVLACSGAPEGPLNVVRALGTCGVPVILVTESADTPAAASRYARRVIHVPGFTRRPDSLIESLHAIAGEHVRRPVVFPTADPDLMLVGRLADQVSGICHVIAPPSELLDQLCNKRRFADLARRLRLPVPATHTPSTLLDIQTICDAANYPVIVKPTHPQAWQQANVAAVVGDAKAISIESSGALFDLCRQLGKHSFDFLIQEYVPGDDEEHHDVHAFLDRDSRPVAWFTGQKLRICPPHAGSGCFVKSVYVEPLVEIALAALERIRYTGIANMNFKRNPDTGRFWLLEINPRVSQWNILASRCGINLPLLAYREACGLPLQQPGRQREDVYYINLRNDFAAFRIYRQEGLLTTFEYLRSLQRRPRINQLLDWSDPRPFVSAVTARVRQRFA